MILSNGTNGETHFKEMDRISGAFHPGPHTCFLDYLFKRDLQDQIKQSLKGKEHWRKEAERRALEMQAKADQA